MAEISPHPAALAPEKLLADCDIKFLRRSGPGGQNRNKVETAVLLKHRPTGLTAEANERRSQAQNREQAIRRLRIELAIEVRRPKTAVTELWKTRCRGGRILVNPEHDDFPALLAEALDQLEDSGLDPRLASDALGCSASQLVKLVKHEPRAFTCWNVRRCNLGLPRLR